MFHPKIPISLVLLLLAAAAPAAADSGQLPSAVRAAESGGASIQGFVTDRRTGSPIPGAFVFLRDPVTRVLIDAVASSQGGYSFSGLGSGQWEVSAFAEGYQPQAFEGHDCQHFTLCAGFDLVATVQGEARDNINFALARLGSLSGKVVDELSRAPIAGAKVSAYTTTTLDLLGYTTSDASGNYTLDGLSPGEIYVGAEAPGHLAEYYLEADAREGFAGARRVAIYPSAITPGIDFSLESEGGIAGRVADAVSGQGIANCLVLARLLAPPAPYHLNAAECAADGSFEIEGLWPGNYQLWVVPRDEHAPYVLGAGSCNVGGDFFEPNCDLAAATPVPVYPGQVTGPLLLPVERAANLHGSVLLPGNPDQASQVVLLDEDGRQVGFFQFHGGSPGGQPLEFDLDHIAPGTYHLVFEGAPYFHNLVWPGETCGRWYCDPQVGTPIVLAPGADAGPFDLATTPLGPYTGCHESETALCLVQDRFEVSVFWRDFRGQSGAARVERLTDETAYFWFFEPGNVELLVKTLNACSPTLGHHFWLFAAGLTDVEFDLQVKDTLTGAERTYHNPQGHAADPVFDLGAFATCDAPDPGSQSLASGHHDSLAFVPDLVSTESKPAKAPSGTGPFGWSSPEPAGAAGTCMPDPDLAEVCLAGGRFKVRVRFGVPPYGPNSVSSIASALTPDTATFNFFSVGNVEVMVKVLDACDQPIRGYWVFAAGLTDLVVEFDVIDNVTGAQKTYRSGPGIFQPIFDLGSFAASCDG